MEVKKKTHSMGPNKYCLLPQVFKIYLMNTLENSFKIIIVLVNQRRKLKIKPIHMISMISHWRHQYGDGSINIAALLLFGGF